MADGIDAEALAMSGGLTWSLGVLVLGLGSMAVPSWQVAVDWLGQFYIGYTSTVVGSLSGAVIGFLDVFIGLYVFASLYNYFRENPVF